MEIGKTTEILKVMEKIQNYTKAGELNYILDIQDTSALVGYYGINQSYDIVEVCRVLAELKDRIRCDYKHLVVDKDTVMVQLEVLQ